MPGSGTPSYESTVTPASPGRVEAMRVKRGSSPPETRSRCARKRSARARSTPGTLAGDDRVLDGDAEALLGAGEPVVLAVVAVALRMGEDDYPVGLEGGERVLDRDRGLALARVAGGVDALLLEPL